MASLAAEAQRSALPGLLGILMLNHNGALSVERRVVVVTGAGGSGCGRSGGIAGYQPDA